MTSASRDVVITGQGVVSPLGVGVKPMIAGLWDNAVAIGPAPWSGVPGNPFAWWAMVPAFDPHEWMDDRVVAGTDLFAQFALAAAVQAVDDAGLDGLDPERTAVVHGTSIGGTRALLKAQHQYETAGPAAVERKTAIQIWPNMAAAQIAMRWGRATVDGVYRVRFRARRDRAGAFAHPFRAGRCRRRRRDRGRAAAGER